MNKTITEENQIKRIMYNVLFDDQRYRNTGRSSHSVTYVDEVEGVEYVITDYNFQYEIHVRVLED